MGEEKGKAHIKKEGKIIASYVSKKSLETSRSLRATRREKTPIEETIGRGRKALIPRR